MELFLSLLIYVFLFFAALKVGGRKDCLHPFFVILTLLFPFLTLIYALTLPDAQKQNARPMRRMQRQILKDKRAKRALL